MLSLLPDVPPPVRLGEIPRVLADDHRGPHPRANDQANHRANGAQGSQDGHQVKEQATAPIFVPGVICSRKERKGRQARERERWDRGGWAGERVSGGFGELTLSDWAGRI